MKPPQDPASGPCRCWEETDARLREKGYRLSDALTSLQWTPNGPMKVTRMLPLISASDSSPETTAEWLRLQSNRNIDFIELSCGMARHARKLERERNEAVLCLKSVLPDMIRDQRLSNRILGLEEVIRQTLLSNLHLADGDDCTLKILKDAIGFDLDEQNADVLLRERLKGK